MRDKLYKTNKKVGFYRARNTLMAIVFLAISAAALTLPYRYVAQAINAYQEKSEDVVLDSVVVEPLVVEPHRI